MKAIYLLLVMALLTGCGVDPVRQAQASAIRTQADMDVARQSATLAQAQILAQAQAEAAIIHAQAAADAERIRAQAAADAKRDTAVIWVVVVSLFIGLPLAVIATIMLATVKRAQEIEREQDARQSYRPQTYVIPARNNRWRLVDNSGNWRYLDLDNAQDVRLLEEAHR